MGTIITILGVLAVILVPLILLIVVGIVIYNNLVKLRNRVDNSWAQISTQLQRRYDLIPNLVETVKGYAKHESETLGAITEMRASIRDKVKSDDPKVAAEAAKAMDQAMVSVNAVAEAYPDLKASQNFLSLQEELSTTENKVSFARQAYNDSVNVYNDKVQTVPSNIVARVAGFTTRDFFEVEDEEARRAPQVQF